MDNLTPITREEMLMNDEPMTPITREEKILAGEDLNPVTRREYFLKKYRHAGGDVMVEGLEVTANGTYTAPEGKAYSPVEVAVPLPENAYLLKEASGSLVSFNDGADLPMPSFVCKIDAVQSGSGDPSPENVRPISGHTGVDAWVRGKNQFNISTLVLKPWNGNNTNNARARAEHAIRLPIGTTFTCSFSDDFTSIYDYSITQLNSDYPASTILNETGWKHEPSITITNNYSEYVGITISRRDFGNITLDDLENTQIQLEIGDQATTYEPYNSNSQTIQVSWQTEAGEVFGGYVDLVSGVLTVTDVYIDLGTCEWLRADLGNGNYRYYNTEISDVVKKPSSTSIMPNIECSHYKNKLPSQYNQAVDGITIYTNGSIQVYDSTKSALTTTDFKTAMDGVQLVYELETPITYQLTPHQIKSLLGNNNAWCSTGDVNVDYFAKEVEG